LPDIFDEVEEDLRNERARALGRRFAGVGIAVAVLILAATAGYELWQQRLTQQADAVADRFIAATTQADHAISNLGKVDKENAAAAIAAFTALANDAPDGYRTLARLRLASLQWLTGKQADAIANWQAVSDDQAAPQLLRDLATLTSAQHQADKGDPVLLKQRLETLTAPDNHWRPMAEQVIALLDIRTGRLKDAARIMRELTTDGTVPEGIRQMAGDLLTTLPPDATAPAAKPAPAPASGPAAPAHG
jgi:hypothetical protein